MSEVKRYEPGVWEVPIERGYIGRLQKLTMLPAPDGEWVKAEDYAAMAEHAAMVEMERDRLRAEVDAFREDAANYYRVAKEADAQQAALRARVARARSLLLKLCESADHMPDDVAEYLHHEGN